MHIPLVAAATIFCLTIRTDGKSMEGRIVGGEPADITLFPFQLSLYLEDDHYCGACLLSKDIAVTAAHCMFGDDTSEQNPTEKYSIAAGNSVHSNGVRVNVSRVKIHPQYNSQHSYNDIAVLYLQNELTLSSNISPVQLPSTADVIIEGSKANVSGWGSTKENNAGSDVLQYVEVEIINQRTCKRNYQGIGRVTKNMLCAGTPSGGKDSCFGDSGGPLTQNGVLIGIVSWGKGCARKGFPGVYTRVAKYLNFLK